MVCTGCLPSSNYPDRHQYLLTVRMPAKQKAKSSSKVLLVNDTTIVPQFNNTNFVYRTDSVHYLSDYYHVFFIQPANMINQLALQYLSTTGLFHYVTDSSSIIKPNYLLDSKVLALYADYRNKNNPKAVIAIKFILFSDHNHQTKIILNKTFREAIPLQTKNSESLIKAWNVGLTRILRQLTYTLPYSLRKNSQGHKTKHSSTSLRLKR
jgi:ABC-type uncharacterized transport system auxiliary subunit